MKQTILSIIFCAGLFLVLKAQTQRELFPVNMPEAAGFMPERLKRIDNVLQQYIDSGWIKGAVGFIAHDSKIVYNKAFGVAQPNVPMKTDDIFRIASQTKAITSVAVMTLFEEGKFLLDDPISNYIPSFANPQILDSFNEKDSSYTTKPAKREITIRDLLTHTSGLDYAQIGSPKMKAIYAKAGVEAGFVNHKKLLATDIDKLGKLPLLINPGEKFIYSLSVDVLGRLVEVVSGMDLEKYMTTRIFAPLGMNDTYFNLPENKANRLISVFTPTPTTNQLIPWQANNFPGMDVNYPLKHYGYYAGGAGLVSTVKDYAIFLQMMLNGGEYNGKRILSRHTVQLMTENQIGNIAFGDNTFGLGFEITTEKGSHKLGISPGSFSWGGFFGTIYWADPKENIIGLLFLQQWPLQHGEIHDKFRALVYQALK